MFCGKCGANVPDGYEFCMKCGTKIDVSQVESTENAVVETKPKKRGINKKVLILVVIAIVIALAVVAVLFGMKVTAEKNGFFANIPWGTDIETVQKKVDKAYECESHIGDDRDCVIVTIDDYDGMQGVKALPILYCEDNGTLSGVTMMFAIDDDSSYTGKKIVDELTEKYNKLFGEAYSSNDYSYQWVTKNSTIELTALTKDLIMLTYNK